MRLEHAALLWLSVVAAGLGVVLVYAWHRSRRRAVDAMGSQGMLERLTRIDLTGSPLRRGVLISASLAAVGFSLAEPQWGAQEVEEQTRALSVVLVLDISESMWAEDVAPNRFERARLEGRRLVTELDGQRVGLVAFAGAGYLMSPLTIDHAAIHLYLDALSPNMAGTPGSSPADGLRIATELLREESSEGGDRAIVILSDGESHDEREAIRAAARAAAAQRIHVYAVGIGTERGEPIPRYDRLGERIGGFKRDPEGGVVLSRLEREPLSEMTELAGGFWARADEGGVAGVLAALDELERGKGRVTRGVRWTPRYQWFIGLALLLLVTDWAWAWRRL